MTRSKTKMPVCPDAWPPATHFFRGCAAICWYISNARNLKGPDATNPTMSTPYNEKDREREKSEALHLASTLERRNEIWLLQLKDAGLVSLFVRLSLPQLLTETKQAKDQSQAVYLATVTVQPGTTVLNFETFTGAFPTATDLYSFLCRAICFPMSRKTPGRPIELRIDCDGKLRHIPGKTMEDFSEMVGQNLGVLVVDVVESSGDISAPARLYMCHKCRKTLAANAISRCSSCRGVNYCGRECQTKDWPAHKSQCKLVKACIGRGKELEDIGTEFVRLDMNILNYLKEKGLLGVGIWRPDVLLGTLNLDTRMNGSIKNPIPLLDGFPKNFSPPTSVLTKGSGFENTPLAISSWSDYAKAKTIPSEIPLPILLSNAMTLFHALTHIFPRTPSRQARPLSTAPGSHICVHIIEASQADVELAPLYQVLTPLLRDVTLDIFIIGPEIVVIPTTTTCIDYMDSAAVLAKRDNSIEYKSDESGSCIRIHLARVAYSEFPRDKYPPTAIFCEGAARKLFAIDEDNDLKRKTLDAISSSEEARIVCSELSEIDATLVQRKFAALSRSVGMQMNPFRQPLAQHLPSLNVPACRNGFLVAVQPTA